MTSTSSDTNGTEHVIYEDKPLRIFPVDRVNLDTIQPHESVNDPDLEAFCDSFRDKGIFYKPILVDRESGTILDGTHRWAGLRKLNASHAPVIQFDYFDNDEIEVFTWYPFSDTPLNEFISFLDTRGFSYREVEDKDLTTYENDRTIMAVSNAHYEINEDPMQLFSELEAEFEFEYTQQIEQLQSFLDNDYCVFLRSSPSKEDVVDTAQAGSSVPPKYTCHRFPYKYPHIMIKFEDLVPGE